MVMFLLAPFSHEAGTFEECKGPTNVRNHSALLDLKESSERENRKQNMGRDEPSPPPNGEHEPADNEEALDLEAERKSFGRYELCPGCL